MTDAPAGVAWLRLAADAVPPDDAWLSPREREVAARLVVPKRHADFRLGRYTAKCALAARLGEPADPKTLARLEILPAPDGAPEPWRDGTRLPLALSLSHAGGLAVCALGPPDRALGCDIEAIEPRSDAFVADFFTEAERTALARAPVDAHPLLATLIWSAKESALKALREGLRLDTRSIEVACATPEGTQAGDWAPITVRAASGSRRFEAYWRAEERHVETLVLAPPPPRA